MARDPSRAGTVVDDRAMLEPLVHLSVWERLLALAQECGGGAKLGMAFLDGSNVRAHPCAAGAAKKGGPAPSGTAAKRSGARAAVGARRR